MDFHGMKRKQLQALYKKHGVSANLTNREMADRLASVFKENEEPASLEKLSTNKEEIGIGNEGKVVQKQAKKVRFSPENQTIVYEVSVYRHRGRSRKQSLSKNPSQVIQNAPISEDMKAEDCRRVTRSRGKHVVENDVNMVFTPPVGRKRGRGGMTNEDTGKSEVLEMCDRDGVKNGYHEVTGAVTRLQIRSRENATKEHSKKIGKSVGGDEVYSMDESFEESDVVGQDVESINGPRRSTRNARKEDQYVTLSSEVEKVEVVSRATRQSRVQSKDVASTVKGTVGIQGGYEAVLQLKEPEKGREKYALRQNAVPQRVGAENSLLAAEGAEAEKPLRRSKRNVEKDCTKSATEVQRETQVGKALEQSEGDIAPEEPQECSRRYSSRRKSVAPQSGKGGEEDHFAKRETRKRTRTTDLDAILKHSDKLERAENAFTSQDQAPLRRSRRKNVIFNSPAPTDAELTNKEDIGKMQQLRAPFLEKDVAEELPRKSSRNASKYSLELSQEDNIAVAPQDRGVKQQTPLILEEEQKTSLIDHHLVAEKPQRRSKRLSSTSATISPPCLIAKVVKKKQQRKSRMTIIEEEAALTENLAAPGELPAGMDDSVVAEGAGNKKDLSLNVSNECSNKNRQGLRGNSGEKQCGFAEASPLFLNMEGCRDSAGNMDETQIATSVKLIGLSTDQIMQKSAHESMVVYEKESNLMGDEREKLVDGGNVESEGNCKSANTKCVLDDPNCSDPKLLELESNVSYVVGSSEITFPAESQGNEMSDQEMKEDRKPMNTHSAEESLVVYKDDESPVESVKERLVQGDTADSETNHNRSSWSPNRRGAADDPNFFVSRQLELGRNNINMDSSEITVLANVLSLEDQTDVTEKESDTDLAGGENTNFASDNVNADDSRTPLAEERILVEIKDTNAPAVESVREAIFEDHLNEFGESSGLKWGLMSAEEMTATGSSNKGVPDSEHSVKATENKESRVEFHAATAETGALKITEIYPSSISNTAAPENPCGPAPENQVKDKTCGVEAAIDTTGCGMLDQERSEDLKLGNAHSISESVIIHAENTGLVKNDEEIHDDTFEGDIEYQSCLPLNGKGAVMVDLGSNGRKVIGPEITSLADVYSSTSHADTAGKTSSQTEEEKVVETEEPSSVGNINSVNDDMDAEGSRILVEVDHIKVQLKDAKVTAAESIGEVIFSDLVNELGESIGLKKGSEIPLTKTEKLNASEFSGGEGIALTESSIKATEMQEYRAEIDIAAIIDSPNSTDIKLSSSSDTANLKTPFGPVSQSQGTVSIAGSEKCNQDEENSLVEDDKGILIQDDTVEGEIKCQLRLSLNTTGTLDDALVDSEMTSVADVCSSASQANVAGENSNKLKLDEVMESKESLSGENMNYKSGKIEVVDDKKHCQEYQGSMHLEDANMSAAEPVQEVVPSDHLNELCEAAPIVVEFESTANKVGCSEMTSAADVFFSASQANVAGETSNEVKLEKVLESEQSLRGENLNYESDKIEVVDDKKHFQEYQDSMHLQDANMSAAEPVQEVVASDHLKDLCESCGSEDFEVSSKKAKETSASYSSGKGMVQTESSVEINKESDHNVTLEAGGKKIMEMQWSLSDHNSTLISPLRPEVGSQDMQGTIFETTASNAGYGMYGHQKNEENEQIVKNDHEETINTEKELFAGGKMILHEGCKGKFLADGVWDHLSGSTEGRLTKHKQNDISKGINNVSGETHENHICEAFGGEGSPVSSEEKDNDMLKSASHVAVSPQCIYNEKLPFNGCPPVSNDMQEKSKAVGMDNMTPRNDIPAHFLSQLALELFGQEIALQLFHNESKAAKPGAESGQVNTRGCSSCRQAFPSEESPAGITSEPVSMRLHDHALVDRRRNSSGENEIVMDQPLSKDLAATMDNNGVGASKGTDVGQYDNVMEEIARFALKVEPGDHNGCCSKVDAKLYDTHTSLLETIFRQTDMFGAMNTQVLEVKPDASLGAALPVEKASCGDIEAARDCSSPISLGGFTSTVGIIEDNKSKVGIVESTLNANDPESGTKV